MNWRNLSRAAVVTLAGLAVACGGGESGGGSSGGGAGAAKDTLTIGFDNAPTNLDPRVGNDQASGRIGDLAYAGLIKPSVRGDYDPDLAQSWETPDDKTIIFKLKPNLKFHNGKPLTSADVKFTYDSLMAEAFTSPKKSGYATVAAIETPDPNTVIFRLKEPNGGMLDNLTLGIIPTGSDPNAMKSQPISAGPYKVVRYTTDEKVELQRFDGWHGGQPKIPNVNVRILPDATTRALEMQQGSIDFAINSLPLDQVNQFEKNPEWKVVKEPGSTYQYLAFNLRDPILKKKEVRQAIAHAIDRQQIVRDLLLGNATATETIFPAGHWARAENLPSYAFDVNKAKQLLDQAGHRDPDGDGPQPRFNLTYKTSTDVEANQQAEMIQQMLKKVGINVQIQSNEFGTFYEDIQNGRFQLFSLRRTGVSDPDFYYVIFHSDSLPPEGQNRGYYINPQVDQLIVQGRSTFDKEKRKAAYQQIQQIVAQDLPYVSLYTRHNIAVMKKGIDGFVMYPSGFLYGVPQMTKN
jgi:peptide/nickel transport system substrate-binding protein